MTTIKLAYWVALTLAELALPRVVERPLAERLPFSVAIAVLVTALAFAWAAFSARRIDPRAGALPRSAATIATTFAAASVVASPASLPLLLIARQRSLEGCVPGVTCHFEMIWLWAALFAIGFAAIPAVFASFLRR